MNILLLYATYSGGTMVASQTVAQALSEKGHTVLSQDVHNQEPAMLDGHDVIIFASPSWEFEGKDGHPHIFYMDFISKTAGKTLPGQKCAVFGLGDTAYPNFCGAVKHLEEFATSLGGELIVESLRIDGYFFNETKNTEKLIAWAENLSAKLK